VKLHDALNHPTMFVWVPVSVSNIPELLENLSPLRPLEEEIVAATARVLESIAIPSQLNEDP
jgi:hypothetical protein